MADNQQVKTIFDRPAYQSDYSPAEEISKALDINNASPEERSLGEAFHGGIKSLQQLVSSYMMKSGKQLMDPEGFEHQGIGRWLFTTGEDWYKDISSDIADDIHRPRFKETEGVKETASWFADVVAEQIPLMAPGVVAGGAVAIAATMAGWPIMAAAAAMYGTVGLTSYILNTGDAYSAQLRKGGKVDEDAADVAGLLAASLDVIIPGMITGKIVKAIGPRLSNKLRDGLQSNLAKNIRLNTGIGTRFRRGLGYAFVEGSTETMQQAIIESNVNYVNDLPLFDYTQEQKEGIKEAFLIGGTAGGAFGVVAPTGARSARKSAAQAEAAADEADAAATDAAEAAVSVEEGPVTAEMEAIDEADDAVVAIEADDGLPPTRRSLRRRAAPVPSAPVSAAPISDVPDTLEGIGPFGTLPTTPVGRAGDRIPLEDTSDILETGEPYAPTRMDRARARRAARRAERSEIDTPVARELPIITGAPSAESVAAADAGLLDVGAPIRPIREKFETAGETGRVLGRHRREARREAEAAARTDEERLAAIEAERVQREKREVADIEAESVSLAESTQRQIQAAVDEANNLMDIVYSRKWEDSRIIRFTAEKAGDVSSKYGQEAANAFNAAVAARMETESRARTAEAEEAVTVAPPTVEAEAAPAKTKKKVTKAVVPGTIVWADDKGVLVATVGAGTPTEGEAIVKKVDDDWVAWFDAEAVTVDGMPESEQKVFKSSEEAKRFVTRTYGSDVETAAIPRGRPPKSKAATAGATPSAPSPAPAPAAAPSPTTTPSPAVAPKVSKPTIGPNMTKKEFDYYDTQEDRVLSQKRINYIASKRVRGTDLNKWESAAILWDKQEERVSRAEGRTRKVTEKPKEKVRKPLRALPYSEVTTNSEGIPLQIIKNDEGSFDLLLGVEDQNTVGTYKSRSTAKNVADALTSSDVGKRLAAPLKREARTLRRGYSDWKKRAVALKGMGEQKRVQAERDAETYRIYRGPQPVPRKVGARFHEVSIGTKELPDGRYETVVYYHQRRGRAVKGDVIGKRAGIPLALFHSDTRAGAEAIRDSIFANKEGFYDLVRMHHEAGNRLIEMGRGDNRVLFHMDEDAFLESWLSRISESERTEIETALASPDVPVSIDIEEATPAEAAMAEKAKAIASAEISKAQLSADRQAVVQQEVDELDAFDERQAAAIEQRKAQREFVEKWDAAVADDEEAAETLSNSPSQIAEIKLILTRFEKTDPIPIGPNLEEILDTMPDEVRGDVLLADDPYEVKWGIPNPAPLQGPKKKVVETEAISVDGIETLKEKLDLAQPEITVSHVGATDLAGMTDDSLRSLEMKDDLSKRLGRNAFTPLPLTETQIDIAEGNDFLEGAGHGADIVVLHRIPDEATAGALKRSGKEIGYEGLSSEGHTLENWKKAIVDSGADLVYIFGSGNTGDFNGLDFQRVPGYEMVGDWNQEGDMGAGQFALLKKVSDPVDEVVELSESIEEEINAELDRVAEAAEVEGVPMPSPEEQSDIGRRVALEKVIAEDELAITDWDATKEIEAEIRNERRLAQKKTDANRVDPAYVLGMTPEEIKRSLKRRPSEGGYSAVEINTLLQNVGSWGEGISRIRGGEEVLIDESVTQKSTRKAKVEALLDWHKIANDYVIMRAADEDAFDAPEIDEAPEFMIEPTDDGAFLRVNEKAPLHNVVKNNADVISRFRNSMNRIWGITATKRMEKIGFIKFATLEEAKELIPRKITDKYLAYSAPTGGIIFIIDNLRAYSSLDTEAVRGIVFHELGVHFGKGIFSEKEFYHILNLTKDLWRLGNPEIQDAYNQVILAYWPKEVFTQKGRLNKMGAELHKDFMDLTDPSAREFWEEVLAHLVENSSPNINPTLWSRIQTAFKLFMKRLLSTWTDDEVLANFTTKDLKNTISYALRSVPDMALARFGDNKATMRLRNFKRKQFLEGSKVTRPLYHYTKHDFHYPVYEFTELGLHLGTMDAAIRTGLRGKETQTIDDYSKLRGQPGYDFIEDPYSPELYNRNLQGVVLNWGRPYPVKIAGKREAIDITSNSIIVFDPHTEEYYYVDEGRNFIIPVAGNEEEISSRLKTESRPIRGDTGLSGIASLGVYEIDLEIAARGLPEPTGEGIEWAQFKDAYVMFPQGGSIKEGYASIKNPLHIPVDLYAWHIPSSWGKFIDIESLTDQSVIDALGSEWSMASKYTGSDPVSFQMKSGQYKAWNSFITDSIKKQAFFNTEILKANEKVKKSTEDWTSPNHPDHRPIDPKAIEIRDSLEEEKENFYKEFSRDMRNILTDFGFDSIEYINFHEHELSRSYIVFNDGQFKTSDTLAWRPENLGMGFKKVLGETMADEVKHTKPLAVVSSQQLGKSIVGNAKADGFLTKMQRLVEPLATVPGWEELEVGRMLAKGESTIAVNQGRIIFDILNQANRKEKKAIFEYFTTRNASPDNLPNRRVDYAEVEAVLGGRRTSGIGVDPDNIQNVSIKDKVIEVKKTIEGYGEELVDKQLISPDQFAELRGKYLPQLYLKYLVDDSMRRSLGTGLKASTLDYTKARKVHEEWVAQILFGKIDDPAFLASRYVGQVGRDVSIIKYLQFIASDPGGHGWIIPQQLVSYRGINGTADFFLHESAGLSHRADIIGKSDPDRAKEMRSIASEMNQAANSVQDFSGYNQKMYKRMPSHPRYGAMRSLLVRKEIYDDLVGLSTSGEMSLPQSFFSDRGLGTRITQVFKYTRVPMNIPTQARNFVSNMILLHTSGSGGMLGLGIPGLVTRSINDIVHNGKYVQIARKYGIEGTTFATEELAKIDRELLTVKVAGDSFEGVKLRGAIFFDNWIDVAGRAYQKSEVLFKVAKIMDMMEKGSKESDAVRAANNAIIDYSQVSQGIRYLRRVPFGSPFITFNAKVFPQLLRNLRDHPLHFLPYVALPYILKEALLAEHDDLDDEDMSTLKKLLPEWARERGGLYFLPFKDSNGRWQALDLGYMLPWTSHFELAKNLARGEFGKAFEGTGMFTGPIDLVVGLKTNEDPFLNKEIWNDSDPPVQQYQDMLGFLTSYIVPPFMSPRNQSGDTITGGGPLIKLMMASDFMEGNIDRDGLPRYTVPQAFASLFGFNTYKVDERSPYKNLSWMEKEVEKIEKRLNTLLMNPNISQKKREELYAAYTEYMADKIRKTSEYFDSVKGYEKLFAE